MLDFVSIETIRHPKKSPSIYPDFLIKKSKDLMIKGRTFYAVWDEAAGFWSTNEDDVSRLVDEMIFEEAKKIEDKADLKLMRIFSSNKWNEWQKYCKSLPDNYHELDSKIVFSNTDVKKTDYVTRTLPYPIAKGTTECYDELMDTLYDPEERQKLEWAIGAIISGDSKSIQKFIVLYGGPGTGKSTVLNIIEDLFQGYCTVFESKALSSASNSFALEAFKDNPLVAIQHDGDLSKIEDNTKLNSIVSHEKMVVNEKFKATYSNYFHSFLFMGTNKPVRITDAKSGIIRRLIDVHPSGRRLDPERYDYLVQNIKFELSGIADHCLKVYKKLGPKKYNNYLPTEMMGETNDFYNFVEDNYDYFLAESENGIRLKTAWMRYKEYCEDANVSYPFSMRVFRTELKNYFADFYPRYGEYRSVYLGFLKDKFVNEEFGEENKDGGIKETDDVFGWLKLDQTESLFDKEFADCPAQYARMEESGEPPMYKWENVKSTLRTIDSRKLHYMKPPVYIICVDFDLKDAEGNKDRKRNLEAASKWPKTYAEYSKSGSGMHLYYVYDGDPSMLSRVYDTDIEIKVFTGSASLRRKLSYCNNIPIATIRSGLPLKEAKNVINADKVKSEKALRNLVIRNLRKEIHPNTKPSIDFIYKILEDAYTSDLSYNLTDLRPAVQSFAFDSSHQADYCLELVSKMKFKSADLELPENEEIRGDDVPIVIYDVEVMPNLFVVCWKRKGEGQPVIKWINPTPAQIEDLVKFRLVGYNNRKYDNHILYARMMGYTNEQIYELSGRIIKGDKDAMFGEAYNLSYTDVFDFLATKQTLKKWEIDLRIHHQELGLRWDKPVPKELWNKVADYCGYDVLATEAVWDSSDGQQDWLAREVLADWAELTVNDTTNTCTTKMIVGNDRNPQRFYNYTDLSTIFPGYEYSPYGIDKSRYNEGTKIVKGKSIYRGEDPGEGGRVYAEPGMYFNAAVLDVASMHPHSAIKLKVFGEEYTMRFKNIVDARIYIKHGDFEKAKEILPERLHKYLKDKAGCKRLAYALKIAINSVYGLTSASFPNKLKDPRNVDNIVAKYGALFMINLQYEVQARGYTVIHIKTDSIKIANADNEIIKFVMDYGKEYGYTFEHEATYSKMCLVNDAVYIAKYASTEFCQSLYGYVPEDNEKHPNEWTATGTQFAVPYVFKTLFSKEQIGVEDMIETKSVTTALYLDFNEKLSDLPFDEDGNPTPDDHPSRHDYRFVGKVGAFCPVKDGVGGGILLREAEEGKYAAAVGTKKPGGKEVYRWMEAEMVKALGLEDSIDRTYYNNLVDKAVETISQYGDFELFVSNDDEDLSWLKVVEDDEEGLPFPMNLPEKEAA